MNEELNLNDLELVSGGNDGLDRESRPANAKRGTNYIIQPNDTLSSIGRTYGSTAWKIFEANKSVIIAEANRRGVFCSNVKDYAGYIWPGTTIVIPA